MRSDRQKMGSPTNELFLLVRRYLMEGARKGLGYEYCAWAEDVVQNKLGELYLCIEARAVTFDPAKDGAFFRTCGYNAAVDLVRSMNRLETITESHLDRVPSTDASDRAVVDPPHEALIITARSLGDDPMIETLSGFAGKRNRKNVFRWRIVMAEQRDDRSRLLSGSRFAGLRDKDALAILYPQEASTKKGMKRVADRMQQRRSRLMKKVRKLSLEKAVEACLTLEPVAARPEFADMELWKDHFDVAHRLVLVGVAIGLSESCLAVLTGMSVEAVDSVIDAARMLLPVQPSANTAGMNLLLSQQVYPSYAAAE